MIKAIVFDIGGVILRTEDPSIRKELSQKYGLQREELEDRVFNSSAAQASTIGQVREEAVWQNIAEKLDLPPEAIEDFKDSFWAGDRLDQDLVDFLQNSRREYATALLSNAWDGIRSQLEEKYGIKEGQTVDHILISSELGVAKPDPKIYRILADILLCEFQEILFVDDFIENVIAARELGIQAIHYQSGMNLISKINHRLNQN